MKVYILINEYGFNYEGGYFVIMGVFTTLDKAVECGNKYLAASNSSEQITKENYENQVEYHEDEYDYSYLYIEEYVCDDLRFDSLDLF